MWRKAWLLMGLLAAPVGCGDPCRALSESVCRCAPSRTEQQRCVRNVRALAGQESQKANDAELAQCQALRASCTCDALIAGDLAACGLSAP